MFQKALWIRNYKQGKYAIWLFWLSTLYALPYKYYTNAQHTAEYLRTTTDTYYMYHLQGADAILFPGLLLMGLAILLIGRERNNQSIDFLWSMPFKRSHLFLSKWLLGIVHIVGALSLSWLFMYIIYRNTIHAQYHSFSPFHLYFVYTIITLIAIYTFTLFIGTITGNIISQSALSYIIIIFPLYIFRLIFPFFALHVDLSQEAYNYNYNKYANSLENTSVVAPLTHFRIDYNYDPQRDTFEDEFGNIQTGPNYHYISPTLTLLSPAIYILICLPLGAYSYTRAPNEHNGKILLYPKLHKYFLICTSICFGLLGGTVFIDGSNSLPLYYIYFIGSGILTYIILQRLLKQKLSLYAK
ncbi:ABC transporter permease subunit [Bacillus pseudomycoides]|uniref:ABC transporter permease n=1 Tax=Bacillus pseudomycoides TaxID=64104 RepID=A0A2B5LLM0_9BACI|nr:ABC transporter permease subunit [Bacillus pseudomycoides]PDY48941.1 ABC transporter permease [Bacillus pseudomycoides]PED09940.1 ABC transporter permease [Bacillus pseudomycoides]PED70835.1 ABC transporter permease [Bacillus pseudomycoides]PEI40173.1 ABC transporter permease [Bacillus pseudomycoides]PEJ79616.1 ABC transporter permease [Bacillus pseudomycoides]